MRVYEIYRKKANDTFGDYEYYAKTPILEQARVICKHLTERGFDCYYFLVGGTYYENGCGGSYHCKKTSNFAK